MSLVFLENQEMKERIPRFFERREHTPLFPQRKKERKKKN
jgi:hypothetical protein